MFTHTANIYDSIYSFKDYASEAKQLFEIINSRKPGASSVLDIGCGTAEHHKYLIDNFKVDGIDISQQFVNISQSKNPTGNYTVADMRNFMLNASYDVILCLFSSIGYLQSTDEIISALACFKKHLNPGGLILIEPWFSPDTWQAGNVNMLTYEKEGIRICRMSHSHRAGNFSILDFQYLIGTKENGVQHFSEKHKLRLSTNEEMISAFQTAGLRVHFEEKGLTGRGMYYAEAITP